jgi:hypothetical protein
VHPQPSTSSLPLIRCTSTCTSCRWSRQPVEAAFAASAALVAQRAVEALADPIQVVQHLDEASAERVYALGDRADLPLELALVTVQSRALHVDHAAEAADQIDQGVEATGQVRKALARVGERRRDLRDARFEPANAFREEIARLG